MKNSKTVFSEIISRLAIFEPSENEAIAYLLMEHLFGTTREGILKNIPLPEWSDESEKNLSTIISRINHGEPAQYVMGQTYFCGLKFLVDQNVLIPRPETEEVVREVTDFLMGAKGKRKIMDIGTGSGCIAISIGAITAAEIFGSDVSEKALDIARKNAEANNVKVTFFKHDILSEDIPLPEVDVIVSNPPYITKSESASMHDNVFRFEPHLALFVPDEQPLLFYERIAAQGRKHLSGKGLLIFEINERFGSKVADLLAEHGYSSVKIVKDISGKDRIVKAIQP
jgi:release factor glutamine methyltransferase